MRKTAALFALLLGLCAAMAPVAPAQAATSHEQKIQAHPFYKALNEEFAKRSGHDLLEYIDQNLQRDTALLAVVSLWLRDHTINQEDASKVNSLFFLTYADTLLVMAEGYRVKGKPADYRALTQTALFNLHIFELMASLDAARCQDPTALAAVRKMVADRLGVFEAGYRMFPRDIVDGMQKAAIQDEFKNLLREPNIDICNFGQARLYDLSRTPGAKRRTVSDPRYPGGKRTVYVPPPGYAYSPAMVPTSQWGDKRDKIIEEVTEEWGKRYNLALR